MTAFPGVKQYQENARKEAQQNGYILINPITKHRVHIQDFNILKLAELLIKAYGKLRAQYILRLENPQDISCFYNFLSAYSTEEYKEYIDELRACKLENIAPDATRIPKELLGIEIKMRSAIQDLEVRKADLEKKAINFKIQGTGALCFKLASVKFFNYLEKNNLLFKVLYAVPVHDEINIEVPEDIAEEVGNALVKAMEDGAKPFCDKLNLSADVSIGDHWIH